MRRDAAIRELVKERPAGEPAFLLHAVQVTVSVSSRSVELTRGMAPANQLRLSFAGSEDGEAETVTCRVAKPLWRTTNRPSGHPGLILPNRPVRTRMPGGVAG